MGVRRCRKDGMGQGIGRRYGGNPQKRWKGIGSNGKEPEGKDVGRTTLKANFLLRVKRYKSMSKTDDSGGSHLACMQVASIISLQ